jgi:branched-chain amino acid transport system substrate-binding protein
MRRRLSGVLALAVAAAVTLTACSSSGGSSGGGASSSAASGKTIKIGVVTDLTGAASSGFLTNNKGIDAYLARLKAEGGVNGQQIEYVTGDTTSTPTGALTAVQKLVQRDKVFAIVENSSFFYGAQAYALQQGIPVVGSALDGPIWTDPKNTNLFASGGLVNSDYAQAAQGQFMKAQGVTKCASIGYSSSVSAQNAAIGFTQSCEQAGLQRGYLNTQFSFGSTDVGPIALAMKNAGVDGVYLPTVPSTGFALVAALGQLGVKPKAFVLATGYGGDLLASKAAIQAGQGVMFSLTGNPAEANTAATKQRAADLAQVGVTGPPTFAENSAYLCMAALVAGLKAAGPNPTRQGFMTALRALKNYDADGLLAPEKIAFSEYNPPTSCFWVAQLEGTGFKVVKDTPTCGPTFKIKK